MNGIFAHAETSGPLRPNVSLIEGLCKNGKDDFKMIATIVWRRKST
jgi:hypothetical protein